MGNLDLYEKLRAVPPEAQKQIGGGRLKGMTEINPMWRIKALTAEFGPCGIGWRYTIDKQWMEAAGQEAAAFCNISLFVKAGGEWSEAIPGTGGSAFYAKERSDLYMSDECYKMALTDALGVACKALGVGANVYWEKDQTKYARPAAEPPKQAEPAPVCMRCKEPIKPGKTKDGKLWAAIDIAEYSQKRYNGGRYCVDCMKIFDAAKKAADIEPPLEDEV